MLGWPIRENGDQGRRRHQRMQAPVRLFHCGAFQPLWQQPGLLQVGPRLTDSPASLQMSGLRVDHLNAVLLRRGFHPGGVLVHYTDPFLLRSNPLHGLRQWLRWWMFFRFLPFYAGRLICYLRRQKPCVALKR